MKKLLLVSVFLSLALIANAQNYGTLPTQPQLPSGGCVSLSANLHLGSADASTLGQVSQLQNFLIAKGYLVMPAGFSTGYFGSLTTRAVLAFQAANGISPAVGFVGPLTRAKIALLSCNTTTPPPLIIETNDVVPHIDSISPTSGAEGTRVTLEGSNFASPTTFYLRAYRPTTGGLDDVIYGFRPEDIFWSNNKIIFDVPSKGLYNEELFRGSSYDIYLDSALPPIIESNKVKFTITSSSNVSFAPHIDSISPRSGVWGQTTVTLYGSGFTLTGNEILLNGSHFSGNVASNRNSISFTLSDHHCDELPPGSMCPTYAMAISPGIKSFSVKNSNGTSNSVNFTVRDGSSGDTIIRRVGDREGFFLIQSINQSSVDGIMYASCCAIGTENQVTLHVGDRVNGVCTTNIETITNINFSNQTVTFRKGYDEANGHFCPP